MSKLDFAAEFEHPQELAALRQISRMTPWPSPSHITCNCAILVNFVHSWLDPAYKATLVHSTCIPLKVTQVVSAILNALNHLESPRSLYQASTTLPFVSIWPPPTSLHTPQLLALLHTLHLYRLTLRLLEPSLRAPRSRWARTESPLSNTFPKEALRTSMSSRYRGGVRHRC